MAQKTISKKDILRRLKIIEGHLRKIIDMVEDDKYCIDILQQTSAVKSAIKKVEDLILDNHLHSCVVRAIKKNESDKVLSEVVEIFKKSVK